MDKQIVFTDVNTAELLDVESQVLGENQVRVKTMFSILNFGKSTLNILGILWTDYYVLLQFSLEW